MQKNTDRTKEVRLLHLDHLQKDILSGITTKFIEHKQIDIKESVEAFVSYINKLAELSASGAKNLCDDVGNLSLDAENYLQKFTESLSICSEHNIGYYKILTSPGIKDLLAKATSPRNRLTLQHIHELEYKIKIQLYSMLENPEEKQNHLSDTEDLYMHGLAAMNPIVMRHAFAEHIIDIMIANSNHTLTDIMGLVNKYAKYLGNNIPSEDYMEGLIQKYSDIEKHRDVGAVHAARIEMFKLLEGEPHE